MKIRLASDITKDSIVDGAGIRAVIWTQGCPHKCNGCHNPQTHCYNGGVEVSVDTIIDDISKLKLHQGITLSGGEPLAQAEACAKIAREAKSKNLDVWMYTGYTFEKIVYEAALKRKDWAELLQYVDVMVDGPFVQEQQNHMLKFKGSANQRIIDVQKSFEIGQVKEYKEVEYLKMSTKVS